LRDAADGYGVIKRIIFVRSAVGEAGIVGIKVEAHCGNGAVFTTCLIASAIKLYYITTTIPHTKPCDRNEGGSVALADTGKHRTRDFVERRDDFVLIINTGVA
jgi:hypothetical protein